ncbi:hypothetical protein [Stenotrophomonas rhizophila]|uniref:Uncharacterized protein n=1 Tax=Stenotrophomonas rhizophila TaxID=216778 RepID=A0AAW5PEF9_9GAMM|nr:hypothetical protein [Stenotrophomonas rhizophila]MCS4278136.1 hypothetical protein [Stenotrophomonas rhizophila]
MIRSWALAGVALALLAGCERTPASSEPAKPQRVLITTPQPEDIVRVRGDHTQRLLAFLRTRYGDKAVLDAPWKDAWEDTEVEALRPVTRSVCARDTVTADGHEQTLLAVCQTLDDAATVEPGRVDLYVLRVGKDDEEANRGGMFAPLPAKDPLLVMAQRLQGPYGRHGAPGTVQIAQLGPQRHAFLITHEQHRRGHRRVWRSYIAEHNHRLRDVAQYRDHLDNLALHGCDGNPADCGAGVFAVDFSTTVGDSNAVDGYWPLTVRASGHDCTGPATEFYHLIFDARQRAYPVPDDLQRDGCADS